MPDDILIRFSVKDDGTPVIERVNKKLGETKKQSNELVPGLEKARGSLTSFVGANAGLIGILTGVGIALGKVIKDHVAYANEVRSLAMISGQGAEETSRFIQVLDDYKIGTEDAMAATRALTKQGLSPSIDTLASLSDKYLALNSAEEKNEFVMKNLGRAGLQWVEVLNKGSKAILAQGDAVAEGLLLNQKQLDDARKLEMAQDALGESWEQMSITIGTKAVPAVTGIIDEFNNTTRAIEIMREKGMNPLLEMLDNSGGYIDALKQAAAETEAQRSAMLNSADAIDANTASLEANKEQLKAITELNQGMLGLIGDIQAAEDSYHQNAEQLNAERIKIEQDKAAEIAKGWQMDADKIAEYDQALADNSAAAAKNAEDHKRANLEIISALVERKLMQDGVLDDKEFQWLLEKRQEWGLYSADVVAKAQAVWQEADHITASIANIPSNKDITITTRHITMYSDLQTSAPGWWNSEHHALGGTFMIPNQAGHEGFAMAPGHTASGGEKVTVTPRNKDVIDYKKLAKVLRDTMAQAG